MQKKESPLVWIQRQFSSTGRSIFEPTFLSRKLVNQWREVHSIIDSTVIGISTRPYIQLIHQFTRNLNLVWCLRPLLVWTKNQWVDKLVSQFSNLLFWAGNWWTNRIAKGQANELIQQQTYDQILNSKHSTENNKIEFRKIGITCHYDSNVSWID